MRASDTASARTIFERDHRFARSAVSYKLALWAFPGSVEDGRIVAAFIDAIQIIELDVPLDAGYITLKDIGGLTFAYLRATGRRPGSGVLRGTIEDCLDELPSAFLGHDDQNGVSIFHATVGDGLYLMSDGDTLGGDLEKLTSGERAEPESAIQLGMRQVFGWAGAQYLRLCHEAHGYDHRTGERAECPADALPLVAFWPEAADWRRSSLRPRRY
jgi:hypothetical protein